jgi:hypothetical protein
MGNLKMIVTPDFEVVQTENMSDTEYATLWMRTKRNYLLSETDWWASSDLTMTAEQTVYRKALRDFPSTATPELDENGGLTGVTWPEKPE